jgi:hypothetical protein
MEARFDLATIASEWSICEAGSWHLWIVGHLVCLGSARTLI